MEETFLLFFVERLRIMDCVVLCFDHSGAPFPKLRCRTSVACVIRLRRARRSGPGSLACFSFMFRSPPRLMSALLELRGMLNKQLWVLVLRTMITVGVQDELRVQQVLLQYERVHRIDEHVVAAVDHECRLSDLLQVGIGIFRRSAPFLQCS